MADLSVWYDFGFGAVQGMAYGLSLAGVALGVAGAVVAAHAPRPPRPTTACPARL